MELFTGCSQTDLRYYKDVLSKFDIPTGNITKIKVVKNGRINTTLVIDMVTENGMRRVTLQKINTTVFTKPVELMENVASVTRHIQNKGKVALNVNSVKEPKESQYLYFDEETNSYWRLYNFIEADVKNNVESANDMESLGNAIGDFSISLNDFDAKILHETIPNFHNTAKRYSHFIATMTSDMSSLGETRYDTCREEVKFILDRGDRSALIVDALRMGIIPYRVSHNDTKLNNVLFNNMTNEPMCLIDLDTVMPGTVLYDFGDAARYGCNTESEEATSTEKVSFNLKYFEALTYGLIEAMKDVITEKEVGLLVDSVWMMTYELVIRFLDDHIDGNHYFGVEYDGKNLERARVQIALLKDIEAKYDEMKKIVEDIWWEI